MKTNLYAHTEPTNSNPAYVSLNKEADGTVSLSVRGRGDGGINCGGVIELNPQQLSDLADAIYKHLYDGE